MVLMTLSCFTWQHPSSLTLDTSIKDTNFPYPIGLVPAFLIPIS